MRTADWTDSVSVLDRMTAVFEAFGDDDRGLGVSEIARRANLPKSTVSRLVSDLVRQQYLDRQGSRLHLGLRLFELGQAVERPRRLRQAAYPVMSELRNASGADVVLGVADGADVVVIAALSAGGQRPVPTGTRVTARSSALGRALLASDPNDLALIHEHRTGISFVDDDPLSGASGVASACVRGTCAIGVVGREIDPHRVGGLVRAAASALSRRLEA